MLVELCPVPKVSYIKIFSVLLYCMISTQNCYSSSLSHHQIWFLKSKEAIELYSGKLMGSVLPDTFSVIFKVFSLGFICHDQRAHELAMAGLFVCI
ncbi:hypothetical protein TanjilG_15999 [Lupinus angustifolius]|uniref:Uncharacterized protein n=1 Tax=Lupinus angustifolius TaxID=3871 RepID=A0A4P1RH38_LUPAN|nr:hypothetical protein TanjilG_15999 [Lupinus angustifolius]